MHGGLGERAKAAKLGYPWYVRQSSYRLWMIILALFAAAAALVLVITWALPQLL